MRGIAFAFLLLACDHSPQARADGYKRAIDTARGVCVAVVIDLEAPTDSSTIKRCEALRSATP